MNQVFVVHHNPANGRYSYPADPADAIASAQAMLAQGESTWVAGNCHRVMRVGDLLLFKFGGPRLRQEPGIYAGAHVTQAPALDSQGRWVLRYEPDPGLTRHLLSTPIIGASLSKLVPRSHGASIQAVRATGRVALRRWLAGTAKACDAGTPITHGLIVLKQYVDKILAGTKTWEIRGKATQRRGPIALIESKSGHVVGTSEIIDVVGPLTLRELRRNASRSGFLPDELPYATTYAWVVRNARRLAEPVWYRHPSGAVIWVLLDDEVVRGIRDASVPT